MKVIKRDGSVEKYDPEKIKRVAFATGVDENTAIEIAKKVTSQLSKVKFKEIPSTKIRDIFLDILKKESEYAAGLYEWYEKTKYKNA